MIRYCRLQKPAADPALSLEYAAAAAVVGLYLEGIRPIPDEELAAAIAVALHQTLHQSRTRRLPERPPVSGWALAGRMSALNSPAARNSSLRALRYA